MDILNGKQLIFLEKDCDNQLSKHGIDYTKFFLRNKFNLPSEQIESMRILYEFHNINRDELNGIIVNKNNVIITHSVYTQGSNLLFNQFAAFIGRNYIRGLIYIDVTGLLGEYINNMLPNIEKNPFDIICGVNSSNIISIKTNEIIITPKLLKIEISSRYSNCVKFVEINQENILSFKG